MPSRRLSELCEVCPIRQVIDNEPERLTEKDLSRVLNRSIASLRDWRRKTNAGRPVGPSFIREEGRIFYPKASVVGYMLRITCNPKNCFLHRAMNIVAMILLCLSILAVNCDRNPANYVEDKVKVTVSKIHKARRRRRDSLVRLLA